MIRKKCLAERKASSFNLGVETNEKVLHIYVISKLVL